MTYDAIYDADDMDDIAIDIAGYFFVEFVVYIVMIVLAIVGIWIFNKMRKEGFVTGSFFKK